MRKIISAFSFFILLAVSGCSIFPTPGRLQTNYFDLDIPEALNTEGVAINILPFSSMSSERYKILMRSSDNRIDGRDDCKWILPPGSMVTKYLRLALRGTPAVKNDLKNHQLVYTLSGSVAAFEGMDGDACLGLTFSISYLRDDRPVKILKTILIKEKMSSFEPKNMPEAMSRAMNKASRIILDSILAEAGSNMKNAQESGALKKTVSGKK